MASLVGADCNGGPGLGKDLMVTKASAKGGGGVLMLTEGVWASREAMQDADVVDRRRR